MWAVLCVCVGEEGRVRRGGGGGEGRAVKVCVLPDSINRQLDPKVSGSS